MEKYNKNDSKVPLRVHVSEQACNAAFTPDEAGASNLRLPTSNCLTALATEQPKTFFSGIHTLKILWKTWMMLTE